MVAIRYLDNTFAEVSYDYDVNSGFVYEDGKALMGAVQRLLDDFKLMKEKEFEAALAKVPF
jgi:hypothetical protein